MFRSIKGVKDILPEEVARWQAIEAAARRLASLYGYQEIRMPIFEVTELFARSIGASTDIVEKEMYTFQDRDGTSLTLRPEGTAGAVRSYIEHNLAASPTAQKLYYLGPMFRHERPQAGRLRQFHQFGVELLGTVNPCADVEVIALLWAFLTELGLPGLTLEMNSLGNATDRPAYKAILLDYLKQREDRLCENCRRRMGTNPLRVLDCKTPACRAATEDAPTMLEHLSAESRQQLEEVLNGLRALTIPFTLNPRLVRGLDYYTLTAFEVTARDLGAQNAVGAGGRYDGLVEALGGPPTPSVGFAVGLERISLMLPATTVPPPPKGTVLVYGCGTLGLLAIAVLRALHPDVRVAAVARYAHQAQHRHVQGRQHSSYLSVASLVQDDLQPRVLVPAAQASRRLHSQAFVTHSDAVLKRSEQGRVRQPVDLHVVGL